MSKLPAELIPLAVLKVRADSSAQQFQALGKLLIHWQAGHRQIRHIWGLPDLLDGKLPRSPCEYFQIPRSLKELTHGNEPVALIMVTPEADGDALTLSLQADLNKLDTGVAGLYDPLNYSYQNR